MLTTREEISSRVGHSVTVKGARCSPGSRDAALFAFDPGGAPGSDAVDAVADKAVCSGGRGLSCLQMGGHWWRCLFGQPEPIPMRFRLSPEPDPAPIVLPRTRRAPPSWIDWQPTSPAFLLVSSA